MVQDGMSLLGSLSAKRGEQEGEREEEGRVSLVVTITTLFDYGNYESCAAKEEREEREKRQGGSSLLPHVHRRFMMMMMMMMLGKKKEQRTLRWFDETAR